MEATLDLLAEGSTIEAIASRAGVGKATIYRRWSGKDALVSDALRTLKGPLPVPAGVAVRDDLVTLLVGVGSEPDDRAAKIMPCLVPQVHRSPEQFRLYQELIEPRRQLMRDVLSAGVERGELRAELDVETALAVLTGPMLMHKLLRWQPERDSHDLAERIVDLVLAGLTPR